MGKYLLVPWERKDTGSSYEENFLPKCYMYSGLWNLVQIIGNYWPEMRTPELPSNSKSCYCCLISFFYEI